MKPKLATCFLVIMLLLSSRVQGEEWFEREDVNCSGLESLGARFRAITGGGVTLRNGSGGGRYFAVVSGSSFSALVRNSQGTVDSVKVLSKPQAQALATGVAQAAESTAVPLFVSVGASATTGLLLPKYTGTAAGILFSFLVDNWNATSVSLREASRFVADGGEVYARTLRMMRPDEANFIGVVSEYRVRVGNEVRAFAVRACVYAVSVDVQEFATTGPFNNKIVRKTSDGLWHQWDVDEKKYENEPLSYVRQEGQYYYFEQNGIESGAVRGKSQHRLSFTGGPWQFKSDASEPGSAFKTLYAKVEAR